MKQATRFGLLPVAVLAGMILSGCAGDMRQGEQQGTTKTETPADAASEYFAVMPEDGRLYVFGDTKNYFGFLAHKEVPLTRTRIGAGPGGRTLVFGITNDDVKKNAPSRGEMLYDGKLPQAAGFHGEVFKDGRYYVFGELKDMKEFVSFGEVPYSYTDIGAGPDGATLVWVMNKGSIKKGRPTATMERFKSLRAGK